MVIIKKFFFVFTVNEKWFAYRFSWANLMGFTACMHVQGEVRGSGTVKKSSYTVENSLLLPEEDIFAGFKKTVQTEVKQAARIVHCGFKRDIETFVQFYNRFANSRKIAGLTTQRLEEMNEALRLSFAYRDEELLAVHSYICDYENGIVRLMHAASKRLDNPGEKQLAGRANKLLHYHDMCVFKKEGMRVYDFGGYAMDTTDKGLQGINAFKLSFGGTVTECRNYFSYPYVLFKKLASLYNK